LTVLETCRLGLYETAHFSWVMDEAQRAIGTGSWTPPFGLLLSPMTVAAAHALVDGWAERFRPEGMNGPQPVVALAAESFAARTGCVARRQVAERLFRLDAVHAPRQPEGAPRLATEADTAICVQWFDDFAADAGATRAPDTAKHVRMRIQNRLVWLWERNGVPVSLVGTAPSIADVTRLGPVFTPRPERGRGYARALTAAVSLARLEAGDLACCLFTDLANPVSNAIYQQIGYRAVGDYARYIFLGGSERA
jgi:predicted GNAT family acetyltransferase